MPEFEPHASLARMREIAENMVNRLIPASEIATQFGVMADEFLAFDEWLKWTSGD